MEPSHSELDEYCKFQRYQYAPAHEMSRALASGRGAWERPALFILNRATSLRAFCIVGPTP